MAISAARRARIQTLALARSRHPTKHEPPPSQITAPSSDDGGLKQEGEPDPNVLLQDGLYKVEDGDVLVAKGCCEPGNLYSPYSHPDNAPLCVAHATTALQKLEYMLNPPRRRGAGHKKCKLNEVTQARCRAMVICLRGYLEPGHTFERASTKAAKVLGRGQQWHARRIRLWIRRFVATGDLPPNNYGRSHVSRINDERIAGEIRLHLQSKGKYVSAEDMVKYLGDADVQRELGLQKSISIWTARRWLHDHGYQWRNEPKSQYFDGHERIDVVEYRTKVYIPAWQSFEPFLMTWDSKTGVAIPPTIPDGRRRIVVWFHDESIFRAHDRQRKRWVRDDERGRLAPSGEGVTVMVADFVSADYGFLRGEAKKDTAREILFPGKNRDGYFTNDKICEQFEQAVKLAKQLYPDMDHIFVYDNARIHTKRLPQALTARYMPKGPSNYRVDVVDPITSQKTKAKMDDAIFSDGSVQPLYFPDDHPKHPGNFKGMAELLKERGIEAEKLKRECKNFKCDPTNPQCCCRRLLFNIFDSKPPMSILESLASRLGARVIFLPKFHCELNPIEQVWGYAKSKYRKYPESSSSADLRINMEKALNEVRLESIQRFAQRSRRFIEQYAVGMDGTEVAKWACKTVKRHRESPENLDV